MVLYLYVVSNRKTSRRHSFCQDTNPNRTILICMSSDVFKSTSPIEPSSHFISSSITILCNCLNATVGWSQNFKILTNVFALIPYRRTTFNSLIRVLLNKLASATRQEAIQRHWPFTSSLWKCSQLVFYTIKKITCYVYLTFSKLHSVHAMIYNV